MIKINHKNYNKKGFCPCQTFLTSATAISSMSFLFSDVFEFERGKPLSARAAAAVNAADDPACNNNGSQY
jgi:hypothetical protein